MNIFGNIFLQISNYEKDLNNDNALYYFKKAIEYNAKNLKLNQLEIDDLIIKYGNKSIEINKALLSANLHLIEDKKDDKEVMLFLVEKYFMLDGLTELFFKSVNKTFDSSSKFINSNCYHGGFKIAKKYIDCENVDCNDCKCNKI